MFEDCFYLSKNEKPYLSIGEQPQQYGVRFRYKTEKTKGLLRGINSTKEKPTFPTLKIHGCSPNEQVLIRGICVTSQEPHLIHGYILDGPDCENGVFNKKVNGNIEFEYQIGIRRVKKRDVAEKLNNCQNCDSNVFNETYNFPKDLTEMDLKSLKIRFELFVKKDNFSIKTDSILTDVITCENPLEICQLSHECGTVEGETKIFILVQKLKTKKLTVIFKDDHDWEVEKQPKEIHNQTVIIVFSPPYNGSILESRIPVKIYLTAQTKTGIARSEAIDFFYVREQLADIQTLTRDYLLSLDQNPDPTQHLENRQRSSEQCCAWPNNTNSYNELEMQMDTEMNIVPHSYLAPSRTYQSMMILNNQSADSYLRTFSPYCPSQST
ncbi:DgyrCDS5796 [Dimorphilus gyrociliatus]|uniref:DgyrCDS5796 n=1 Tax=Dimorphilus gyrociliatus TaxID=2664684 RepID=A0A7I8VNB2_9ANNE|nr:DgyrCDS5796 [Dimorphilus gyrociliatus]